MGLKAKSRVSPRPMGVRDRDRPLLPPLGKRRRIDENPMHIEAKLGVELREFP